MQCTEIKFINLKKIESIFPWKSEMAERSP